ncbi:hypothetical protein QTL95_10235 [Rhizobium sp. S152]|uniref:hypothetical protein n=1 Tax=Rhizobium sp. S152 TaxID=3055038 RepID=UPI0025A96CC2|nr:hypothetical protein [Rhizobium sp. S152]MDM9626276.1 hypothetical protein [Rhizobium sp. S152]
MSNYLNIDDGHDIPLRHLATLNAVSQEIADAFISVRAKERSSTLDDNSPETDVLLEIATLCMERGLHDTHAQSVEHTLLAGIDRLRRVLPNETRTSNATWSWWTTERDTYLLSLYDEKFTRWQPITRSRSTLARLRNEAIEEFCETEQYPLRWDGRTTTFDELSQKAGQSAHEFELERRNFKVKVVAQVDRHLRELLVERGEHERRLNLARELFPDLLGDDQ